MRTPVVLVGLTVPMSLSLLGHRLSLMADRGWEVHVAVGEEVPPVYATDERVTVHVVPMTREISPRADLASLCAWSTLIREVSPTHVVGATPKAGFLSMIAARRNQVPHRVFEAWGARWDGATGVRGRILREADRRTVLSATSVVAVSSSLADLFVAHGIAKSRPIVLGHGATQGVNTERFHPRLAPRELSEPPVVGFLGRLAHDKGISDLPYVMDAVHQSMPEARLSIAGALDSADPLDVYTRSWLETSPTTALLGQTDDVAGFLHSIDVLCFPSQREGLPNAVIEAAACAVPVVAWDVTGTRDAIVDGETGFLVPHGDRASMAACVMSILRDRGLAKRLGVAARNMASQRFDSHEVQTSFVEYIAGLQ